MYNDVELHLFKLYYTLHRIKCCSSAAGGSNALVTTCNLWAKTWRRPWSDRQNCCR